MENGNRGSLILFIRPVLHAMRQSNNLMLLVVSWQSLDAGFWVCIYQLLQGRLRVGAVLRPQCRYILPIIQIAMFCPASEGSFQEEYADGEGFDLSIARPPNRKL